MSRAYFKRQHYLEKIRPYLGKQIIKVITGLRRSGKSFFLKQLKDELFQEGLEESHFLLVDMEEIENDWIQDYKDLVKHVDEYFKGVSGKPVLFVDEIQEIKGWEKAIRSYLNKGFEVIITGSNAELLSSEIATMLTGRVIEIEMYPLSFREFKEFTKKDDLWEYIKYGGMPIQYDFSMEQEHQRFELLKSVINTIVLKDVVARHAIRDVHLLENLLQYTYKNIGNLFTAKSIVDYLKSQRMKKSVDTVLNYLKYLEDSYALHRVQRWDIKGKRVLEVQEKHYASDLGLRHAVIGYDLTDISGILENVVYLELKRRGYRVYVGKYEDLEIDFIGEKRGKLIYIQVCYKMESDAVIKREFQGMLDIRDNYPKYVLSMDEDFERGSQGIHWMNIRDFLIASEDTY